MAKLSVGFVLFRHDNATGMMFQTSAKIGDKLDDNFEIGIRIVKWKQLGWMKAFNGKSALALKVADMDSPAL
ncbi:hypothetical protein GGI10_002402 [Coemansia sp. RSA 2530]|nr:hypothetical protein GGI10_002402 [Coemansia sp. RSA 2530]